MDTDHTYISMEAEWLPGHDECDDHDDKAILRNLIFFYNLRKLLYRVSVIHGCNKKQNLP